MLLKIQVYTYETLQKSCIEDFIFVQGGPAFPRCVTVIQYKNPPQKIRCSSKSTHYLDGGFQICFYFTRNLGEMIQFDFRIFFQMGWFNHFL